MHGLRALTLVFLWAALFSEAVFAEIRTLKWETNYRTLGVSEDSRVRQWEQTLRYQVERWLSDFSASVALQSVSPDYRSYLLTRRDGSTVSLGEQAGESREFAGLVGLEWNPGIRHAKIAFAGSLTPSPFRYQTISLEWGETFFHQTTDAGLRLSAGLSHQPENYFVDTGLHTRSRPTLLHESRFAAYVDQVLTERWRTNLEISTTARPEERPRNIGIAVKQGYSFSDRIFGRIALERMTELRREELLNERGYFSASSLMLGLTFEPWYDLLVGTSYALVVEDESHPESLREVRVGSDQLGLSVRYRGDRWGADFQSGYRILNTGMNDLSVGGGLSLKI